MATACVSGLRDARWISRNLASTCAASDFTSRSSSSVFSVYRWPATWTVTERFTPELYHGAGAWYLHEMGRLVDVRPAERRALLWSFLCFFFLLGGYYVLRPLRDEMAIAGGVDHLQWLFTGTLATMVIAVPVWSALVARLPARRLIAFTYRFFVVNLLLFYGLLRMPGEHVGVARAFFVWTSVFNLFAVSIFWSLLSDIFRRQQGKRLFGFISAGGSAGAIAGPLATSLLVETIGPVNLLLIAAALLEAAATCAGRLGAWARAHLDDAVETDQQPLDAVAPAAAPAKGAAQESGVGGDAWAALLLLLRSPYLGAIAGYVLLLTSTGTLAYMLQARLVAAEGLSSAGRTALFARIDLMVNIGAAIAQTAIAGRLMSRFGVGPSLALSPVLTVASAVTMAAAPRLGVLVAGNVARRIAEYAISRPAREVLFTVVQREEKYKPKALIDMVVYRGGDAASSWIFTAIGRTGASVPTLALSVIPLAAVWLALAVWLARRHERAPTPADSR
jgi:AAA family ATP:ADP antiporter